MLVLLSIAQLVVGGLMIVAFGVVLFLQFRWQNSEGALDPEKKKRIRFYFICILIGLALPNLILIILTRTLS